ncbi:MAG TPA: DUF433 domain-containing protein [Aggregatilineales bacterium]|nr:DUF433 domain-containing protein [Aggregatilineales bacterium]
MATVHSIDWIISDEKIRSGRPVISGTTICVADIAVVKVFHRKDADEIAAWFEIPLSKVYAALAYYYDHKDEIDTDIRVRQAIAEDFKEQRIGSRHPPLFG